MRLPPWTRLKYIYKSTYNQRKKEREHQYKQNTHIQIYSYQREKEERGESGGKDNKDFYFAYNLPSLFFTLETFCFFSGVSCKLSSD